jgi:hypothetical protein
MKDIKQYYDLKSKNCLKRDDMRNIIYILFMPI